MKPQGGAGRAATRIQRVAGHVVAPQSQTSAGESADEGVPALRYMVDASPTGALAFGAWPSSPLLLPDGPERQTVLIDWRSRRSVAAAAMYPAVMGRKYTKQSAFACDFWLHSVRLLCGYNPSVFACDFRSNLAIACDYRSARRDACAVECGRVVRISLMISVFFKRENEILYTLFLIISVIFKRENAYFAPFFVQFHERKWIPENCQGRGGGTESQGAYLRRSGV